MLPDSHRAPINENVPDAVVAAARRGGSAFELAGAGALTLADAFSEFISASGRLEGSYRELQQEVAQLSRELAARNAALNASLAENERMRVALEQIVDSMPCGVLVLEGGGRVAMINHEGTRLLGTDAQAASDLKKVSLASGVQLEAFYRDDQAGEAEQELAQPGEGGKRWLGVRKRRLFAPAGQGRPNQTDQTILILRDITAHKQAEEEREAARKSMALAEVAALLAHEIRNPLASLELFAGLIVDDPGRREEWCAHLRAGIRSLAGTVTNVLSFHSLGRMQRSELDLAATIRAAVEFTRPITDQAGLALDFEAASELRVSANQGALQQVVLNMIANAIRHTQPGGRIDVSVRGTGPHAVVEFADSGSGIAADQLPHIFEPGFSGSGQSCGLGLAVCRQIVAHHGGTIRVTSHLGRGATFHVELPTL